MKLGGVLLLLVGILALQVPSASAAEQIEASGITANTAAPTVTLVSSNGEVAIVDVTAVSAFSGTFNGSSIATDRCVERLSTGQASCEGQEAFTGTVAGRPGTVTVTFHDAFKINFATGATKGVSSIVGGTANVRGVLSFSGNAFGPLPYQGHIVLI